jgi:hypothetical protein
MRIHAYSQACKSARKDMYVFADIPVIFLTAMEIGEV